MSTSTDLRSSILARARALDFPCVIVAGFATVAGSEDSWQARLRTVFDVELRAVERQLDDLEASRPAPLPERRSALDAVPMAEDELAEQRARRAEDEAERIRTRARQDEDLRQALLREKGIE